MGRGRDVREDPGLVSQPPDGQERAVEPRINLPRAKIAEFCREHGIRRLSLFGAVLRDNLSPAGLSTEGILINYPSLISEAVRAALACAADPARRV